MESGPNQAPVFQSDGNLSIPENQTFVFDFNATDPDGDTLTYSLPYGDDHLLFDVNASTGILTFLTPKDFESPEDNDSNNRYEATIQVSDGNTSVTLNLFVHVTDAVENSSDYRGVDISGLNLSGQDLSNAQFDENTIFSTASPGGGPQQGVNLSGTGANLSNIPFVNADFRGVNLAGVNLSNANLSGAQFDNQTIFSAPNPGGGPNFAANLSNTNNTGAILSGIDPNADLRGVNLAGVRLSTPGFNGLMDQTTVFSIPNPAGGGNIGANLSGSDANLANRGNMAVDFRGVNLSGVNFANTDLSNAQFDQFTVFSSHDPGSGQSSAAYLGNTSANLANIPFVNVDFRGVNLAGVNLSNANLSGAQFDHQTIFSESPDATFAANLSNSNGTGAILSGIAPNADLRGVNLAGVRLSTPGFHGLMDQTTVFSIPNPAGGGNIGANLSGSDANLANIPMGTVDFRGVNLSGVNLSNSDLSNAQFDQHTIFSTHDPGTGQSSAVNLLGTGANLASIPFAAVDFRGVNLAGVNLSNANLSGAQFDHQTIFSAPNPGGGPNFAANLSNSNNTGAILSGIAPNADLRGVNLAGVRLSSPGFNGLMDETTVFSIPNPAGGGNIGANLSGSGASLINTPLGTVDFRGVNLSGVNLSNSDLNNALFDQHTVFSTHDPGTGQSAAVNLLGTGANLANIPFVNVDFRGVNLAGVNLSNADLSNAQFDHQTVFSAPNPGGGPNFAANLSNTNGTGAILSGIAPNADLRGVNLAGVRLSSPGFNGLMDQTTVFSIPNPAGGGNIGANLSGSGASLINLPMGTVDFRGVNLSGVNLSNSDLSNAQFDQHTVFSSHDGGTGQSAAANLLGTGANLSNIPFVNVDFRGVNLAGVNLSNADLSSAQFDHQTIFSAPNPGGGPNFAANLSNTNNTEAILSGIAPSADLRGVNLAGVRLSTPGFNGLMDQTTIFSIPNPAGGGNIGANLSGSDANLANIPMGTVDFRGVNLSGVNLSNSDLSNALFDQFTVFSTGSSGGAGPQPGANLLGTGANLSNIPFVNADFSGVNLAGVNLSNADLSSAQFDHQTIFSAPNPGGGPNFAANLSNTNGTGTVLSGIAHSTDFRGVNLGSLNLVGLDLSGTLMDASTILTSATYSSSTLWPAGIDPVAKGAILVSGNQAPSITSPAVANVSENQTFVIDVNATDPDGDPITYSVMGGSDQAKFEINATNGVLRFKNAPDFEANASAAGNNAYFLIVRASDGSAEDNQTITVNVTDAVESTPNQAPAFQSDGNLSIPENQTFVFDFNATDSDGDTLTYSLAYGDDHLLFDANASTGILTFLTPKDFESPEDNDSNNRYEATIQVSDGNTSVPLNLFVHVTDAVESAPNQAPVFQSDGNLSIPENQTFVFDFNATDSDGDTLTYSLAYGDDHLLFGVNASTGILTFLTPKDFESPEDNDSNNRYEATIQVSDGNTSVSLNLFVQVTDVVESAPNQAPAFQSNGNLSIPENQSFVFDFNATDPDGDTLTYSLAYGDDAHLFEIIPSSGLLAFKSPPDFESPEDNNSDNRYEATIQVSDGNTSVSLNLFVQITDAIESTPNQAPVFQSDGNLSIPENQSFVFDFNATDPDGDTLTYSLAYGDDAHLFEIIPSSGLLAFKSPTDFESPEDNNSDNRYEATIQVSDGNSSVTLSAQVQVIDLADDSGTTNSPPALHAFLEPLLIAENAAIGTVIGHLHASDPDPNDTLTFSLSPDAPHSLFEVASNGLIRTASSVDFEKNASHLLFLRVTDSFGAFADGNVTVEVIDLFRPVAETGMAESITETSAYLQGFVLDDGGLPVIERGFLISTRPSLEAGSEAVLRLIVDQNASDFSSTANGLQPGKKYFYRAYASNEEGISLGSKETFVTPEQGSEPTWIEAQPSATKDWWISAWFGSFYQNPNGWALHEQLGWIFPVQSPTAGLWLWKEEMGWLWTDREIYPFLYHNSNESWLYFYGQLDGYRLFYDYDRKEWIIVRDE